MIIALLAGISVGFCLYKAGYYMGRADQLLEDTRDKRYLRCE